MKILERPTPHGMETGGIALICSPTLKRLCSAEGIVAAHSSTYTRIEFGRRRKSGDGPKAQGQIVCVIVVFDVRVKDEVLKSVILAW